MSSPRWSALPHRPAHRPGQWLLALLACLLMSCAGLPPASAVPREESRALAQPQATTLGRALLADSRAADGRSGFRLVYTGLEAFLMRMALIEASERTLDVQYYIYRNDDTGRLIAAALLRAADRGVRVRMLIDDLNVKEDTGVAALDAHPNIEIRLFNPFPLRGGWLGRAASFSADPFRLNRRMHNKSLIADNAAALVGGRNIGDEYFDASRDLGFADLDILAGGPIVATISTSFDQYWNSDFAYPLNALGAPPPTAAALERARGVLAEHAKRMQDSDYLRKLERTPLAQRLAEGNLQLVWADSRLAVDDPAKIEDSDDKNARPMGQLAELARTARSELLISSPYFIPGDAGTALLVRLARAGVTVRVLTNSLAATDVAPAHAGYLSSRKKLLTASVDLFELKPRAEPGGRSFNLGSSKASLHTKLFIVDDRAITVGSLNLDPRSHHLNTELALIVYSEELARAAQAEFDKSIDPKHSYAVVLDERGQVVWRTERDGEPVEFHHEPEAGLWRRFVARVLSWLPIDSQL